MIRSWKRSFVAASAACALAQTAFAQFVAPKTVTLPTAPTAAAVAGSSARAFALPVSALPAPAASVHTAPPLAAPAATLRAQSVLTPLSSVVAAVAQLPKDDPSAKSGEMSRFFDNSTETDNSDVENPLLNLPHPAARAFADSSLSWLRRSGEDFDAKILEWNAWARNPARWLSDQSISGMIDEHTAGNLKKIIRRIDRLQGAKIRFATEALSVDPERDLTPKQVSRLYDAWDSLRGEIIDLYIIWADSRAKDASKRGLISNVDQNTGRHPAGAPLLASPAEAVDWDAAYELNDILR